MTMVHGYRGGEYGAAVELSSAVFVSLTQELARKKINNVTVELIELSSELRRNGFQLVLVNRAPGKLDGKIQRNLFGDACFAVDAYKQQRKNSATKDKDRLDALLRDTQSELELLQKETPRECGAIVAKTLHEMILQQTIQKIQSVIDDRSIGESDVVYSTIDPKVNETSELFHYARMGRPELGLMVLAANKIPQHLIDRFSHIVGKPKASIIAAMVSMILQAPSIEAINLNKYYEVAEQIVGLKNVLDVALKEIFRAYVLDQLVVSYNQTTEQINIQYTEKNPKILCAIGQTLQAKGMCFTIDRDADGGKSILASLAEISTVLEHGRGEAAMPSVTLSNS